MQVDIPEVRAELEAAFARYEQALLANDFDALSALFWNSPLTLRYGVRELLYSHAEIDQFRRERGAIDQRRTLRNTRITTFGRDFGVAHTEYLPHGATRIGRQSQTWVRSDAGWKIVAAHVSFLET
ncbi:MAG TPA: oxalurate catabolism protein HpxZ [Burkholderiales bacterium]|jgi:1-carboxybiuret hydrolase subunit AtzH-like protein|nr:oxalurate catabolism protein HpxZ [Burkholderiales bacterium]